MRLDMVKVIEPLNPQRLCPWSFHKNHMSDIMSLSAACSKKCELKGRTRLVHTAIIDSTAVNQLCPNVISYTQKYQRRELVLVEAQELPLKFQKRRDSRDIPVLDIGFISTSSLPLSSSILLPAERIPRLLVGKNTHRTVRQLRINRQGHCVHDACC